MPDEAHIARRLKLVWEDNVGEGGGTKLTIRITDPSGKHSVVGAAGSLYPPEKLDDARDLARKALDVIYNRFLVPASAAPNVGPGPGAPAGGAGPVR